EKLLKESGDKISGDARSRIEKAIADVKDALKGSDVSAIKTSSDRLNEAWQAVSAELYKAASEKRGQPGSAGSGTGARQEGDKKDEGPIIDAEVVDEKK